MCDQYTFTARNTTFPFAIQYNSIMYYYYHYHSPAQHTRCACRRQYLSVPMHAAAHVDLCAPADRLYSIPTLLYSTELLTFHHFVSPPIFTTQFPTRLSLFFFYPPDAIYRGSDIIQYCTRNAYLCIKSRTEF